MRRSAGTVVPPSRRERHGALARNTLGGVVGNILEWYDFAVFGYFAPLIGEQFFPSTSRTASLLGAFGVFAGAYFVRPLGGVLFGNLGDRLGRKRALQLSVFMMAVPTTAVAILPTYAQVGWLAPLLIVLCRLAQGLSVGGELIGSMAFITEIAPAGSRGLFGSFVVCTSTMGVMLGSGVAALVHASLDHASLASWGWRLPFAAGLVIGLVGFWMRGGMGESPVFEQLERTGGLSANPVREVVRTMTGSVCFVACLVMLSGGGFYILFVWWPTFLEQMVDPPIRDALVLNTLSMVVLAACTPIAGWLSDLYGRRAVLVTSILGVAVLAMPLFAMAARGSPGSALAAQVVFAPLMAGVSAPIPATIMELFPTRTRYSGVALGYNISLAVFGGTAPLMATMLVSATGTSAAPAGYLMFLASVSLLAAQTVHRFVPREPLLVVRGSNA